MNLHLSRIPYCGDAKSYVSIKSLFNRTLAVLALMVFASSINASNSISVRAKGNVGTENIYLDINGAQVTSWSLQNSYTTFTYNTEQNVEQVRIGHNSGSWPNAAIIDFIEVNGIKYESEDASTFSVGSWDSVNGCAEGFKRSEWLSCNGGYFDFPVTGNVVKVRARGNQGTESVNLTVNGSPVASWSTNTSHQSYTYLSTSPVESVQVGHSSGNWPNAVIVDYIEVNGVKYESENASTFSVGSWDSVNGCAEGYKRSEWLSCNGGYFNYAISDDPDGNQKPLVIFDTDMGPDIDDALALALLHRYASLGKVEIAAVTVSRDSAMAARYIDVINTTYGRPTIPIGIYRGGTVSASQANNDGFTQIAVNYPHDVHLSPLQDGHLLMREVLANAAGRPVIIIQTGFSGTVSALMNSAADSSSSLTGRELIEANVDILGFMGGKFNGSSTPEFNIINDLGSAQNVIRNWPVDMVVSSWDLGARLFYPYAEGVRDIFTPSHPVRAAYEFRVLSWHRELDPNPPAEFYNMASWDLTSVIQTIEPEQLYFKVGQPGTLSVSNNGFTVFSENSSGQHRMLFLPDNPQRTINRMIELLR